jgi:hypothetical protein
MWLLGAETIPVFIISYVGGSAGSVVVRDSLNFVRVRSLASFLILLCISPPARKACWQGRVEEAGAGAKQPPRPCHHQS